MEKITTPQTTHSADINDIVDFLIVAADEAGMYLNVLKIHLLLYYAQGWHVSLYEDPLFAGKFQAWVHGPIHQGLFQRFKDEDKTLYSDVTLDSIRTTFLGDNVSSDVRSHIDSILGAYGKFSSGQLQSLVHRDPAYCKTREGYDSASRCEKEIDEVLMGDTHRNKTNVISPKN